MELQYICGSKKKKKHKLPHFEVNPDSFADLILD